MAREASVRIGLNIRKLSGSITLMDENISAGFTADVDGTKGPTPGALTIPTGGKAVSFEELSTPSLCVLKNSDATNYVSYGIYDPQTDVYYPLGELLPGESYVLRLSRDLQEEYVGTGTGTTAANNQFFMKADGADVEVTVKAFEK